MRQTIWVRSFQPSQLWTHLHNENQAPVEAVRVLHGPMQHLAFTTCSFLVRTIVEHSSLHTCLMFLVWCCHCILQRLCHSKPLFLSSLHASGLHWRSAASLHWIVHSWWKLWSLWSNIFVSMLKRACDACIINCVWSTWCQRVVNFSNQAQGNTTPTTPVLRIEKGSYLHQLPSCINVIGKGRVYSNSSLWSKFILLESKFIQHNVQHTVQHNIDSYGII